MWFLAQPLVMARQPLLQLSLQALVLALVLVLSLLQVQLHLLRLAQPYLQPLVSRLPR
jgi:hypothetical protein